MRFFALIWQITSLAYFRRALIEMPPLHPDVPEVVHEIHRLERAITAQFAGTPNPTV